MGFIQNAKEFFGMASPTEQPDYAEDYVESEDFSDKYNDSYGYGCLLYTSPSPRDRG